MATVVDEFPEPQVDIDSVADSDSAYGDEVSQYTASVTSSVYDYQVKNGRRYHAFREGQYLLPNDEQESERLDIHHALMRKVLDDKLYWAPIGEGALRVLDVATGTGIWAMDFGDEHPGAQVIGNDLTPGPTEVPPNVSFYVDDIEDEWIYEKDPFDYIHCRFMCGSVRDWPKLMSQIYKCVKPNGWVEFADWDLIPYSLDNTIDEKSEYWKWSTMTVQARESAGFNMRPGKFLEEWVRGAGFTNVNVHKLVIPLGPWPKNRKFKELGVYNLLQLEAAIEGLSLGTLPFADPPWTIPQIEEYMVTMRAELRNRKTHALYNFN